MGNYVPKISFIFTFLLLYQPEAIGGNGHATQCTHTIIALIHTSSHCFT